MAHSDSRLTLIELAKRLTVYSIAITATGGALLFIATLITPLAAKPIIKEAVDAAVRAEETRAMGREDVLAAQFALLNENLTGLREELHNARSRK